MAINMLPSKAVFLDKDGTLIKNVPYNVNPDLIELAEGAVDGLKLLNKAGYKLIVVSNQSGIARGLFKESDLDVVQKRISELLKKAGLPLAGFYYCPHHPDGKLRDYTLNCMCRKPRPGMLFTAAREFSINLASSWMVGDILDDIEAGRRADCNTILVNNGNETEWSLSPLRRPHYSAPNLLEAARIIINPGKPQSLDVMKNIRSSSGAAL
jgi:D-glycero-D-manno-heptose 1,7-bisphosphate phosphatase